MPELVEKHAMLALLSDSTKARIKDAIREQLRDALYCTRVWDAWSVGTMSEEDFVCLADIDDYVDDMAETVLKSLLG